MALERATKLLEILIRFDDSGTELCRAIDMEVIFDGEEVIVSRELPPREITLDDLKALIDEKSAPLIAELSSLKQGRDEVRAALERERDEAKQAAIDLSVELAAARAADQLFTAE